MLKTMSVAGVLIFFHIGLFAQSDQEVVFRPGERLEYKVQYGWITGGKASLTLKKDEYAGNTAYHAKAIGRTVGLADKLFYVYDVYESTFHPVSCLPYKAVRNVREMKFRRYNKVYFNHEERKLRSLRSGRVQYPDTIRTQIFDIISAFYFARNYMYKEFYPGEMIDLNTYFTDKFWLLQVRYKGKETIETEFGNIPCLKFTPLVEVGRIFKTPEDVTLYISDDANRIPIYAKMDIIVGSFKIRLSDYEGLKYPLKTE